MVSPDGKGVIRNHLLTDLQAALQEEPPRSTLADFGCGPGNLIPHLQGKIRELVGVDRSRRALAMARERVEAHQIAFTAHAADLCRLDLGRRFDLIISVNAILPPTRPDVLAMLASIRRHLKPSGRFMAILPSFDTTVYLQGLCHQHHLQQTGNTEQARRMAEAFEKERKMDALDCAFADDGQTAQCYHTPETIDRQLSQAGLQRIRPLRKIYYPWELAQKFDYGYFPEALEEIWDWYVVCGAEDSRIQGVEGQGID
jgi:SAM-dependent methyltransferase